MDEKTENKEIKRSTIFNTIALVIRAAIGAFFSIFLANYFSVSDYGSLMIIMAFINISCSFSDLGISVAASRFVTKAITIRKNQNITISGAIVLRVFFSLLIFILVLFFHKFISNNILNKPYLSIYIKNISFAILFTTLMYFFGRMVQGFHKPSYNSIAIIIDSTLYSSSSLIMILIYGFGLAGIIYGFTIGKFIALFIIFLLFLHLLHVYNITFCINRKTVKIIQSLFKYSLPLTITTLLAVFFTQVPIILIGRMLDQNNAAIYSIPSRIVFILLLPSEALIYSASSFLVHHKELSLTKLSKRIAKIYTFCISIYLPLLIFFLIFSPRIISFLIDVFIKKEIYSNSISILYILSFLLITGSFHRISGAILAYIGHPGIEATSNILSAILLIGLSQIFVRIYHLNGMAFVVILTSFSNAIFMLGFIFKKYEILKYLNKKKLIIILFICLLMTILFILINKLENNFISLLISGIILIFSIVFMYSKLNTLLLEKIKK